MSAQTIQRVEVPTTSAAGTERYARPEDSEAWNALFKWVALASSYPLVVPADAQLPCAGMQPEMFYEQRHWLKARQVCADCPIRQHCLEVAVARDEDGVWGGMTKAQRDRWVAAGRGAETARVVPAPVPQPVAELAATS